MLDRINEFVLHICEVVIGVLMLLMTAVVLLGVYHRYVLGDALVWSEMLSRYCMIWMSFLAAVILLKEDGHIGISYLRDIAPPKFRKALRVVGDLIIMTFLVLWLQSSWEAYELVKDDIVSGLNVPLGWVFISQPVCSLFMLFQAVLLLIRHITENPKQVNTVGASGHTDDETGGATA